LAARRTVIAALLCAFLFAGCGGGSSDDPDASEIVAAATEQTAAAESFRFSLEVENVPPADSGLSLTSADGEVVVPDRLRAEASGTFSRIPIETELVLVGDDDYFLDPLTRQWRRLDVGTSPVELFDPAKGVLGVIENAQDVEYAGEESVRGVPTHHLTGTIEASDAAPLLAVSNATDELVDVELWIGKDDSLLRRIVVRGPVGAGEPDEAARTVELDDFGQEFAIEAPEVEE
jgi:LppX_LprAFG lipoprotein